MPASRRLLGAAAALSGVAAAIHATVMNGHFEQWWGYGAFFLVASMAQGVYAFAIVFPPILHGEPLTKLWPRRNLRLFLAVGMAGNLAIILLWAITRTVGIPYLGPLAGTVEPVGVVDGVSKAVEATLVGILAVLFRQSRRARTPGRPPP